MMHAIANSEECVPVTEGAGYIGSHVVSSPLEAGYKVVVLDNLSTGFREAMPGELPVKQLVLAWSASRADHLLDYRRRYHSDERLGTQVGEVTLRTDRADPRRHAGSRIEYFTRTCNGLANLSKACSVLLVKKTVSTSSGRHNREP